jgi:hypothetical protein
MKARDLYTKVEQPVDVSLFIPYTKPTQKLQFVIDCLRIQQVQPKLALVGPGTEYHDLLSENWERGETFYVVEQDVVVWQGAIQQLEMCDHDWCSLPTMCHGRMISTTFGCVKFSKRLIAKNPGFWADIPTTWYHLDAGFADKIGWPWIKPHVHWPPATHLNEVQWADEISTRYTLERKLVWQSHEEGRAVARVNFRSVGDERIPFWKRKRGSHVGVARVEES